MRIWKRRGFSKTFSGPNTLQLTVLSALSVLAYSFDRSVVFPDFASKNTDNDTAARSHCNAINESRKIHGFNDLERNIIHTPLEKLIHVLI